MMFVVSPMRLTIMPLLRVVALMKFPMVRSVFELEAVMCGEDNAGVHGLRNLHLDRLRDRYYGCRNSGTWICAGTCKQGCQGKPQNG
jgi:hypothetical protein